MMMATLGQEDSIFAVLAVCCAILITIYMITSKTMNEELRKPFVAVFMATTVGVLVYASQSIPLIVMINLLIIVNALQRSSVTSTRSESPSEPVRQGKRNLVAVGFATLLIALSIGYHVIGPAKLVAMANRHPQPVMTIPQVATTPVTTATVVTTPALVPTPAATSTVMPTIPPSTSADPQQTAFSSYQQAKIEQDASTHTLDAAWQHLSKVSTKTALNSWKNAQTQWSKSKHDTCGKDDEINDQDIKTLSATDLNIQTKRLQCERDANLNRATYLSNNAYTVSEEKGHIDDDIGNLISTLNKK